MRTKAEQIKDARRNIADWATAKSRKHSLKRIEKICLKWGGIDDWGVAYIYIDTLLGKLSQEEES